MRSPTGLGRPAGASQPPRRWIGNSSAVTPPNCTPCPALNNYQFPLTPSQPLYWSQKLQLPNSWHDWLDWQAWPAQQAEITQLLPAGIGSPQLSPHIASACTTPTHAPPHVNRRAVRDYQPAVLSARRRWYTAARLSIGMKSSCFCTSWKGFNLRNTEIGSCHSRPNLSEMTSPRIMFTDIHQFDGNLLIFICWM